MINDYKETESSEHSGAVAHLNLEHLRQHVWDLCHLKPEEKPNMKTEGEQEVPPLVEELLATDGDSEMGSPLI